MNYCPECGYEVERCAMIDDVATTHDRYLCKKCRREWEETVERSSGRILNITLVEVEELPRMKAIPLHRY